ncbi:hypothetical protein NTGM5_180062 [Candidatus Nitrotoga sp. M5]|nr:hypothetical protein NTGM5_180062 [Candidatus Nitrotoga sp. M5]
MPGKLLSGIIEYLPGPAQRVLYIIVSAYGSSTFFESFRFPLLTTNAWPEPR